MTDIGNFFMIAGIGCLIVIVLHEVYRLIKIIRNKVSCRHSSQVEPVPVQSKGTLISYGLNKNPVKATLRASAFDCQPGADDLTGVRTQHLPLPIPEPISAREYPPQYNPDIV